MGGKFVWKMLVVAVLAVAALIAAPSAAAEPGNDPCSLAVSFLCRLVPMAPELEGDTDLTQQQPGGGSAVLLPDTAPPADPCVRGCI